MKKSLFVGMLLAAGMLFSTSCSRDNELDVVQSEGVAQVTFSLAAEGGIATRAISDGKSADLLYYAIFDADKKLIKTIATSENGLLTKEGAFPQRSKKDEVTVTLAKGQEYTAVFWAQDADCNAYTVTAEEDGLKVAVDYAGKNNDETRDAFFKAETFKVAGNTKIDVDLKRPFAQINVGVTEADWNAAVASGIDITESKVVIKNAATSINLLDGSVDGNVAVEYDFATIPHKFATSETLNVDVNKDGTIQDGEKYTYLSMSYILTDYGAARTTLESDGLQFTFKSAGKDIIFDEGLDAVPVQRNWRTNILGNILTGNVQFNIVIDERHDGDIIINNGGEPTTNEIAPGVTVEGNIYYISSAAGLQWLSDVVNGTATIANGYAQDFTRNNFFNKTVVLTNDIDLSNKNWTAISKDCSIGGDGLSQSFSGIFDGGNHTISNMTVEGEDYVGLFAKASGTIKNVKMRNVYVKGTKFAGAIIGYIYGTVENCHVEGGEILINTKDGKNGDKAGGIVGYIGEGNGIVKDSSVKNLSVTAYCDVAGLVGCAQPEATITNNRLDNVAVIANMLQNGEKTLDEVNADKVVGRNIANADLSSNTTNNVTVTVYGIDENGEATVGNVAQVTYAINKGATTINLTDGVYDATKLTAIAGKTLTFIGSSENAIFDYTSQGYNQYVSGNSGNFTFKDMTIARSTETFAGMAHTSSTSYENCTITGTYYVYETTAKFTNCKFNVTGNFYNCWLYGNSTTTYVGCTFNCSGKSIYVDGNGNTGSDLIAENCTFNDNGGVEDKAAIETGTTYGKRYSLTVNKTTVNGFAINPEGINTESTLWANKHSMTQDKLNVVVDGVDVY